MRQVLDLRFDVLMAPFGVTRDDDWDDADPASLHLVAIEDGRAVGYARLIVHGAEGQVRQVAVAFDRQRSGIGSSSCGRCAPKPSTAGSMWCICMHGTLPNRLHEARLRQGE